jgi:hypothetical protein
MGEVVRTGVFREADVTLMTKYKTPVGYLGPRGAPERVFYARASTYRSPTDYDELTPDDPEMKELADARTEGRIWAEPIRSVGFFAMQQFFGNEYVTQVSTGLY